MRFLITVLTVTLLFSACGSDGGKGSRDKAVTAGTEAAIQPDEGKVAVMTRNLPLDACLEEQNAEVEVETNQCPTFILLALDYMIQECTAGGGALQPMADPEAWTLDVDGDGKSEMLVDLTKNYICYGAPAVSSCGSLGCPHFLYAQRGDAWVELGAVNADDAPKIEVLDGPAGTPATLRGGCLGHRPCSELTHYEWKGEAYEASWISYRGHAVDVVPGGLWTLTQNAVVRTEPKKGGQALDEYPAGTAMVVIGTARGAPYQFVSPCNSCRRGFIETALLKK